MQPVLRTLLLGTALLGVTTACSLHDAYEPALPAARTFVDKSPLVPMTAPLEALRATEQAPVPPPGVPSPTEWQQYQRQRPPEPRSQERSVPPPTTQRARSALVRYAYQPEIVYDIRTAPASPTYLVLPAGERLAAPPAVNPDAWAVGVVQMGQEASRQEAVVIRPLHAGQDATTALLFQSGLMLFCKLRSVEKGGMVRVSWEMPAPPVAMEPETPITQRPPLMDLGRLHTAYRIEPQGKLTPPWLPVSVVDDGTRTYIKFKEALTYTRAPGVFGLTPQGSTALVQSHMYVMPGQPERGAWLLVQGLWPALELKDSAGLTVRVVRQAPQATVAEQ